MEKEILEICHCQICYTIFEEKAHEPYVLPCGHNMCTISMEKIFQNNESLQCPTCRKPFKAQDIKKFPINYFTMQTLEILKSKKHKTIIKVEKYINESVKEITKAIQQENRVLEQKVQEIINMKNKFVDFNNTLIKQMKAYQSLIQVDWQPLILLGINEGMQQIVEKDIKNWQNNFLKYNDKLINHQDQLKKQIQSLKFTNISKIDICQDYSNLIKNTIKQIDIQDQQNLNYQIVKNENINEVLYILRKQQYIDDLVTLAWLYYLGIGVQKNKQTALMFISKDQCSQNGRANYLKYIITEDLQMENKRKGLQYLLNSCQLGYPNAVCEFGFRLEDFIKLLDQTHLETVFFAISSFLDSCSGQSNFGNRYLLGDGINKDIEKGAKYIFKALERGHISQIRKIQLDQIYDLTNKFKKQQPNYQKWQCSYDQFQNQKIILL